MTSGTKEEIIKFQAVEIERIEFGGEKYVKICFGCSYYIFVIR